MKAKKRSILLTPREANRMQKLSPTFYRSYDTENTMGNQLQPLWNCIY